MTRRAAQPVVSCDPGRKSATGDCGSHDRPGRTTDQSHGPQETDRIIESAAPPTSTPTAPSAHPTSSPSSPTGGRVRRRRHQGISNELPRPRGRVSLSNLAHLPKRPDRASRPPSWGRIRPLDPVPGRKSAIEALGFRGAGPYSARMAQRCSRAEDIWEMSGSANSWRFHPAAGQQYRWTSARLRSGR